ncbi:filamin-A [Elysia marginata]|uniref:Filamin-A n=1 Tax=Elysia marginata TaxID=1093978 RepID=A0AAV4GEM0_9GAST|nr:filamin-A [Elysia marginata]
MCVVHAYNVTTPNMLKRSEWTHGTRVHSIRASLQGEQVKGSPFQVRTFDPSLVRISKVKQGIVGVPCKFTEAGEGSVEVGVQCQNQSQGGRHVPTTVLSSGRGRYDCSFIGQTEGHYQVQVTYNDMHAQGSPFSVNVVDVGGIRITGDHWNLIPLEERAGFSIVSPHGSFDDLSVKIVAPNGTHVPFRLGERGDGTAKLDWQPTVVGSHKVFIDYAGVAVQGSPFTIKVFDASQVRVSNIHPGLVNRPCSFALDASTAGDGNLEILVMHGDEIVPNYVQDEGNTAFKVTFTPRHAGLHLVHTQFNGVAVPGSPHQVHVLDPESVEVTGSGVNMAAANVPTSFRVDMRNAGDAKLNVRVICVYKVYVECAGVPAKGSPFNCNVYDPSLIRINAPGRAYLGRPIHFNLDTSAAGRGKLDFQVTCRGHDVPTRLREVGPERYDISFTPQQGAPHRVHVNFNDLQVPGTPFDVAVIDGSNVNVSGNGVRLAKVFKEAMLTLDHDGLDEQDIEVKVIAPSGNTLPARLTHHSNNTSQISFTPLEVGGHRVYVTVGDDPISGSPFTCNVYDPSACRITEVDKTAKREREIGFTIDSSAAGAGTLEVEVTHRGQPVRTECYKLSEGRHSYTFRPREVGRYEVRASFNGDTIPGTPLIIDVEEDTPTFIRIHFSSSEPIKASGRNSFLLQMNGHRVDRNMLNVIIKAPNGENIPARLIQQADGDYKVEWTPNVPGRHAIEVLFGGQQVSGSPFYIDVFDIHKIRVNNFYNGNINETAGFKVDCTQAGKGNQEIRIESPSGRNVPFEVVENPPLEHHVTYTPTESGQHKIFISYSNMELNEYALKNIRKIDTLYTQNTLELAYADDVDFVSTTDFVDVETIQKELADFRLNVNTNKTEYTLVQKTEKIGKTVKKVGSLLGDPKDIERRKHLSNLALQKQSSIWIRNEVKCYPAQVSNAAVCATAWYGQRQNASCYLPLSRRSQLAKTRHTGQTR